MSDTVKLIIEIPKDYYEALAKTEEIISLQRNGKTLMSVIYSAVANGTPLDSNDSDYAEAQAYFAGEAYGWEQGRKALIDDVKAEIEQNAYPIVHRVNNHEKGMTLYGILQVLDNIGKAESEMQNADDRI